MTLQMAILSSGTGSNALALLDRAKKLQDRCRVATLICDQPNAPVLKTAPSYAVDCVLIPKQIQNQSQHEEKILSVLKDKKIDWIFLAGYMRVLSPHFIKNFCMPDEATSRIVNIHPSLLPQFPGIKAYEKAFAANINPHGITVHFVDEGIDTGPIIAQEKFPRLPSDTLDDFIERGKSVEHSLYPEVFEKIATGVTL